MNSSICIFEDEKYLNFLPLCYSRPVFDLRCGINLLKEKVFRHFKSQNKILYCRDYLVEKVKFENPKSLVNELKGDEIIFINARLLISSDLVREIKKEKDDIIYYSENSVAAAKISKKNLNVVFEKFPGILSFQELQLRSMKIKTNSLNYIWDLIKENGNQIVSDYYAIIKNQKNFVGRKFDGAYLINKKEIFIGEGTKIYPTVVIDASDGPVYIGKNVTILPNSAIQGPAFIGDNSIIKMKASIYHDTSIGDVCKVGGEVEGSIIHSYSNKQHDGFLGHAYLGSFVNLGADTTNSDLKNNYSKVSVMLNNKSIDTGMQFLGLIMGDHSKTGINTMFNTGTIVGFASNIFGTGFPPKYVTSFAWGTADYFETHDLQRAMKTAEIVMGRRKIEFGSIEKKLFQKIFELTEEERKSFRESKKLS